MKISVQFLPQLAALGALALSAQIALAQSTVETTTTRTTSMGTIQESGPDSITVSTQTSPTPVHYAFTKTTTYVDENGNPVSVETVRSGVPVTVYYDQEGDRMVASKVVVRESVDTSSDGARSTQPTSATATSADGTVNQFSPDTIAVTTSSSPTPVSYSFSKTTTYVDENGNPVSVDVVKSGVPVTVFYDYENGRPVASKVVVKGSSATTTTDQGPAVIEHKTTTTSTTTTPNP